MREDLPADSAPWLARLREVLARDASLSEPHVELIKPAELGGPRVGVFASSFNPVTVAHVELMRRALTEFSLDEVLALAGRANADKSHYECALEDRLRMLTLAVAEEPRLAVGLSSHAFYVDMLDALAPLYRQSDLHFVVGFDTFERVLDRNDRYTLKYHRRFGSRREALAHLFSRGRFIVAGRAGAGHDDVRALLAAEPAEFGGRVSYLDFPADLGERSASEVRTHRRAGRPITGFVPPAVETYIVARGLYE